MLRSVSLTARCLGALERIQDLLGYGMIAHRAGSRIAVTPAGFPVLDSVVADLAA
ncbi:hypothetical protein [Enterovirga rhinocerotis]|uniref:hypothetical protein n=1 Tax=Enterovirga rhinocerotis TaxID=1339210 RepID=UPI0014152DA5|nr:hypothetical protein [Enterovirga rhinocerotis]